MIEQIHIKDVATFKDEYLSDLKKVHFIYGFKRCEFNFTWWTDCGFTWT